jgi:catechol 2,3-dioxygenase-like lactoylglutathione lyase family enzyme
MIDHVTLQVSDVGVSRRFYEPLLAVLGAKLGADEESFVGFFGDGGGSFWLIPAERLADRELHLAFSARDRAEVRAFHTAAVAGDIEILHAPRLFPEYHESYYATFVRDPDGHNVEAVCHLPEA